MYHNSKKKSSSGSWLRITALCLSVFCYASCGPDAEKQPDISGIKTELNTMRLDKDLARADTAHLAQALTALQQQYPDFLNFYLDTLMGFGIKGNYTDTNQGIQQGLKRFLTYKDYKELFDTVAVHYPDTKKIEASLVQGFGYMKHYYPAYEVPRIVYFVSGLANWGVVTYDHVLGIGLDMFLGEHYPYYASVGQPDYMYINFRPVSIAPSVFSSVYQDIYPFSEEDKTLLDMMLRKGKQQYFLQKMLPFVAIEDRIGYTKKQLEWCEANEALIYNFFLEKGLIYEKNWQKMMRYVNYGPGSTGMPAECPGNIGTWIGLRIIQAYAREHAALSPDQIFKEENAAKILKESRYKPK